MLEALTVLLKIALYAGLLCASGAVFARATLRLLPDEASHLTRIMRWGAVLILCACPLIQLVLILRLGGEFDRVTLSAVFASSSGAALFLQMTGGALLLMSSRDEEAV